MSAARGATRGSFPVIERRAWLGLAFVLIASTAQAQHAFPASRDELRAVLCANHRPCRVESVLSAGTHRCVPFAVVRVRRGGVCALELGYRDELVSFENGAVRALRTLVIGSEPCLEWQLSSWRYRGGELLFEYGMMGAPIAVPSGSTGRTVLHVRPWPLAIVSATDGASARSRRPRRPHEVRSSCSRWSSVCQLRDDLRDLPIGDATQLARGPVQRHVALLEHRDAPIPRFV